MTSSSDRTRKKASQAIYNELATNVRNNHNVSPVKNNGYTYNSLGITRYDSVDTNKSQTAISNYSSYSERMSLKLGKQFSNSAINGTENLKYDIRAGNLLQVKYNTGGYSAPLLSTGDLDADGGKLMRNDFIPYGTTIDYPGFITDYSNNIFKTTGVGTSDNQQQGWIRNLTTLQHKGSEQWNKLNAAEQMTGFSLTSPILLWTAFEINITDNPSDVSGYIFNGIHRKGELQNIINPTLYYDVNDHIKFILNLTPEYDISINTSNSNNTPLTNNDIFYKNGIIEWNPKKSGVFYYSGDFYYNNVSPTNMIGKVVIGNISSGPNGSTIESGTSTSSGSTSSNGYF